MSKVIKLNRTKQVTFPVHQRKVAGACDGKVRSAELKLLDKAGKMALVVHIEGQDDDSNGIAIISAEDAQRSARLGNDLVVAACDTYEYIGCIQVPADSIAQVLQLA